MKGASQERLNEIQDLIMRQIETRKAELLRKYKKL